MLKCITPDWPAPPQVKSCTTTRDFGSLVEDINRKTLIEQLNLPSKPIWLKQVHGIRNVQAEPDNVDCEADASFSNKPNSVCVIMTADCLPVLFCDKAGKQIAAVHAGWRGLAAGVLEETLKNFNVASPEDILVWLGPAIGPEKFEVGDEVRDVFIKHLPEAEQAQIQDHYPGSQRQVLQVRSVHGWLEAPLWLWHGQQFDYLGEWRCRRQAGIGGRQNHDRAGHRGRVQGGCLEYYPGAKSRQDRF